jgi:hypothetical protein
MRRMDIASAQAIVDELMRQVIRSFILKFARTFGTRVVEAESGRSLGRALIVPWAGKIHIIGLEQSVRAEFQPQKRLTYWKQEIVFKLHPPPDFPNERDSRQIDNR